MRIGLIGLLLVLVLFAGCTSELVGTVVVIGNEPFTLVALETEGGVYELQGDVAEELREFQGQSVRVSGSFEEGMRTERAILVRSYEILE